MMKCLYCGNTIDDNAQFCSFCGKDLSSLDRCPHCGSPLEHDATFCTSCGNNVQDTTLGLPPLPIINEVEQMSTPAQTQTIESPLNDTTSSDGPKATLIDDEPTTGKKKIISAVIALVALAGIGAAGYWWWTNQANANPLLNIDYMPFREHEDGNWGMIGKDGKVLFSDEFKNKPTIAHHGRFWVKNNDGLWEMYTTDKDPQKIGEHYDQAGAFIENVAPVVPHNQPITFIDKNGEVKFTLTKVDGKTVTKCTNFTDGVAIFTAGGKQGCINTKGEVVVKPEYDAIFPAFDGKMFAANRGDGENSKDVVKIMSVTGEVLSTFTEDDDIADPILIFNSGVFVAEQEMANGDQRAGLMNEKAEWVVKPNPNFHRITDIYDGYFIFYDGDNYGLANKKGEIIIRPKYDKLKFAHKGKLLFAKGDYKDSEWELINFDEESIGDASLHDVEYFIGSLAPVEISEHYWGFINSKGVLQDLETTIYSLDVDEFGDSEFESQYVDVEAYADALDINKDGFLGLSLEQTANDIFTHLRQLTSDNIGNDPKDFTYSTQISKSIPLEQSEGEFTAAFDGQFVDEKNNWVTDEWGYEYIESTEYRYNEKKPQRLELKIPRRGLLKGRMSPLTSQVIAKVKALGSVEKENKNAVVVKSGHRTWVVAYTGSDLVIACGNIDTNSLDIDAYKDVDEDSDVSLNITSSTEDQIAVAVDSAATEMVDTVAAVPSGGSLSGSKTLHGEVAGLKVNGNFYFYSDGTFRGSYGYNGNTTGITVRGTISGRRIYAEEFNGDSMQCGIYNGTVANSTCSGNFANSKGSSYNFFWNFY